MNSVFFFRLKDEIVKSWFKDEKEDLKEQLKNKIFTKDEDITNNIKNILNYIKKDLGLINNEVVLPKIKY